MTDLNWKPDQALELDVVMKVMAETSGYCEDDIYGIVRSIIGALHHLVSEKYSFRLPEVGVIGQRTDAGVINNILDGPVNVKRANLATRKMILEYALGSNIHINDAMKLYERIWGILGSVIKTMLDLGHPVVLPGIGCIIPKAGHYEWSPVPDELQEIKKVVSTAIAEKVVG